MLHKRWALLLRMAHRRPSETLHDEAVLAATSKQDGPVLCPPRCPDTLFTGQEFAHAWGVRVPHERASVGPLWMAEGPATTPCLIRVERAGHPLVNEREAQAAPSVKAICQLPRDGVDKRGDVLCRAHHTAVIHCGPRRLLCVGQSEIRRQATCMHTVKKKTHVLQVVILVLTAVFWASKGWQAVRETTSCFKGWQAVRETTSCFTFRHML